MNDAKLTPAERMALTVGYCQVSEGRDVGQNVAGVCILALARLVGADQDDAALGEQEER